MSPSMLLELRAGFEERITELGQTFVLDKDPNQFEFEGILMPVQPIDPQLELGSDWREMATLEASRERIPWNIINYGDTLTQKHPFWATEVLTDEPKWKIIRRDDNPANFSIKYWLVKVTTKDAQS